MPKIAYLTNGVSLAIKYEQLTGVYNLEQGKSRKVEF